MKSMSFNFQFKKYYFIFIESSFLSILYVLYACFCLYSFIFSGDVVLCDSGDNIHEYVNVDHINDNNKNIDGGTVNPIMPKPGLLFRLKTRVVWYVNGKNTGLYRSFDDYRNS
jgi:hypothetical protein